MNATAKRPYLWLFGLLAVIGFSADQVSKYVVFAEVYPEDHRAWAAQTVIPGHFELRTNYTYDSFSTDSPLYTVRTISGTRIPHVNRGALFGIGNAESESEGMNTFFAGVSLLAAGFIVFWTLRPSIAQDRFLCFALGMVLGGTLGNLYDRIVFSGVRDFLHCFYEAHIWPDFNIADCCLVCGASVLLVHSFLVSDTAAQPAPAAEPVTALQTTSSSTGG